MSSNPLPAITAVGGIVLFIGGLFYFIYWANKKLEEAFHETARLANLRAVPSGVDDRWKLKAAYEGTVDGARIRLSLGSQVVSAGNTSAPISGVLLESAFSVPLPFEVEMRRNAGLAAKNYRHSDPAFTTQCAIQTDDPARTNRLLDDPALRSSIAAFLKEGQGSALIQKSAAFTVLFDVRQSGPPGTLRRIRSIASLSKQLSDKAKNL